jgi:serine protease AprX
MLQMRILLCLVYLHIGLSTLGQSKYFIVLKDKKQSSYKVTEPNKFLSQRAIDRRKVQKISVKEHDLPVSEIYLKAIRETGAKVEGVSKWLNAVLIEANKTQLAAVKSLPFFDKIELDLSIASARIRAQSEFQNKLDVNVDYNYGSSLIQNEQLGVDKLHKKNITGKGVLIGILDSGFDRANTIDVFKDVYAQKRVLETYDFVDKETNVYNDHNHGTLVMSCIGSNASGRLIGTAPEASFVLYKTEDVNSETLIEEVYWLFGAERADSVGVDIINSSLGYTQFDVASQNHVYADMNGDKTICARAADFAAATGIMVVVSAGNDGSSPWKYISTPADADSVISVGAIDAAGNIGSFSSFGPSAKNGIKPELVARGVSTVIGTGSNTVGASNGTSFSSPVLAGFVATLRQAYPSIPVMKLREIIIKSGNLYLNPNERYGYGLPNATRASELADAYLQSQVLGNEPTISPKLNVFPNPISDNSIKIEIDGKELEPEAQIGIYQKSTGIRINTSAYKSLNTVFKSMATGTYLLEVNSLNGETLRSTIVKL